MNEKLMEEIEAQARDRRAALQSDNDGRAFRAALAQSKTPAGSEAEAKNTPGRRALPALGFALAGAAVATVVWKAVSTDKPTPGKSEHAAVASPEPTPLPTLIAKKSARRTTKDTPSAPRIFPTPRLVAAVGEDFRTAPSVQPAFPTLPSPRTQIGNNAKPPEAQLVPQNPTDDGAFLKGDGVEGFARRWGTLSESETTTLTRQWEKSVRGGDDFVHVSVPQLAGVGNAGMGEALRSYQQERQVVDARLQHRVTLALKGESFSELCALLSQEAGIELTAAKNVADDKVTIFCTNRPVRELLREIVNLFGFVVERSGPEENYRYRLSQPLRAQLLEEELRSRDSSEALVDLDRQLEALQKLAENRTPEELRDEALNASGERKALLEKLGKNGWGAAKLFGNLGQDQLSALRAGKTLRFSGAELPENLRAGVLGSQDGPYLTSGPDGRPTMGKQKEGAVLPGSFPGIEPSVTLSLTRNELGQFTLTGSAGGRIQTGPVAGFKWNNLVELGVGVSPSMRSPENAKARAARREESQFQAIVEVGSATKKPVATTADVLERLHALTGRDIVADYFTRLVDLDAALPKKNASLFAALCKLGDICKLRWDERDGILTFRSVSFFNDRPKEVPNRLLRKWRENRKSDGEAAPLDNALEMCQLRDEQLGADAMAEGIVALYGLDEWRLARSANLRESWRVLASLPRPLRADARTERGVGFWQLSAAQRQRFVNLNWADLQQAEEILGTPELFGKLGDATFRLKVDFAARTDRERAMFALAAPTLDRVSLFFADGSRAGGRDMPMRY